MSKRFCCSAILGIALVALVAGIGVARQIVVNNVADSGTGTLRWALTAAESGDTITFDSKIFLAETPATIYLRSELPPLGRGGVTLDGSDAGVIIDGSKVPGDWSNGVQIYADRNVVRGLQIVHFTGSGIAVASASHNTIGGDRSIGEGPIGQGNLLSGNGIGIDLCDAGTHNVIAGNIVGTDATLTQRWGNKCRGIWVEDGVSDTQIGPDNVVVFNGCAGIAVTGPRAVRNTITQNRVYQNEKHEILLEGGANNEAEAPRILRYAPTIGELAGVAPPFSIIEVFSSGVAGVVVYEGQADADSAGTFTAVIDLPASTRSLVATATNRLGNTGPLSAPLQLLLGTHTLQPGNMLSLSVFPTERRAVSLPGAVGGDIGNWAQGDYTGSVYDSLLTTVLDLGITWVRTNFCSPNPFNWQEVLVAPGRHIVDPEAAAFITDLTSNGINVILTLGVGAGLDSHPFGPLCWGTPGRGVLGQREPQRWFAEQSERDAFCQYARFMAEHFRGRVQYYEIWNEPSSGDYPADCRGAVSVQDYALLLNQVVPAIRQADPQARVIAGALGRFNERERAWLVEFLQLGVGPIVDGLSWHPFYGNSPGQGTDGPEYWEQYPSAVVRFMSDARDLGFAGEYFVDEMVWRTRNDDVAHEPPVYTENEAAKYNARAILLHAALGFRAVGSQLLMPAVIRQTPRYYVIQRLASALAGAVVVSGQIEIHMDFDGPMAYCSFRYPSGDRILALWTDGVAQEEDPGVAAVIKFPGLTAGRVTGIDVLHGFEQELIFDTQGGSTKVSDILVKDYPILIRLSDLTFGPDYVETVGDGFHRLGDPSVGGVGGRPDRDGDGVPDDEDLCPDWPGKPESSGC